MVVYEISPARGTENSRPVELVCFALIFGQLLYLFASYWQGSWITAQNGGGVPSDFVDVWAAGRLVLQGNPAAVYDWPTHKAMEVAALGHPFAGYFGWHYPPTFLAVAALLATMPYSSALIFFLLSTFCAYMFCLRAILGSRDGFVLAAAFPAVLANCIAGQNGFLSAALLGGTLLFIEPRPILAGLLLGLLTYKPHLGLLFPVALAAGGHWRAFVTAGIVAALMAAASCGAFGTQAWAAFYANIGHTSQAFLSEGWADFGKLQTAFGLVRTFGGGEALAWSVQAVVALVTAAGVAALWRSRAEYEIKAAALGAGAMLATPYLYTYDLAVLAVPLAFLWRLGRARGFLAHEFAAIALVCLLLLIFPFVTAPTGLAAVLVVAALIVRRALAAPCPMARPTA